MYRSVPDTQLPERPERRRGRLNRLAAIVGGLMLLAANIRVFELATRWGDVLLVTAALSLACGWRWRAATRMKKLASREDLSEAASRALGMRRMALVWYEYAIARNVARGTYHDEPPADFLNDVFDNSMRLRLATKLALRQVGWMFLALAGISITLSLITFPRNPVGAALLSTALIVLLGFLVAIGLLFVWFASRRSPLSTLGKQVENVAELDGEQRWQELLRIAAIQNALEHRA